MTFHFEEQLDHIDFKTEPTSNMYPMSTNHATLQIAGYGWQGNRRPNTKEDITIVEVIEIPEKKSEKPAENVIENKGESINELMKNKLIPGGQ